MNRGLTGHYVSLPSAGEACKAFVPQPLPPEPPLQADGELDALHERATLALGRLDGLSGALPDPQLFLYTYIRKEAVLSSQIEGTQSSLADLLLFENEAAPGVPLDDVREVSSYVGAIEHGLKRLSELPLSLRLLKEMHAVLLAKGRGSEKEPGEFRRSQNWIGGTRPGNALFVPPPPDHLVDCLGALEKFLHGDSAKMPLLVKMGLAHAQFETIHPFLDGNGRLGRLLITLMLCAEGALHEPLLHLSLYFKRHRQEYYQLLQQTRLNGDWEAWLKFFLRGMAETADQAADNIHRLLKLAAADEAHIRQLGRATPTALRVHRYLLRRPIGSVAVVARELKLSLPATRKALENLRKLGIVRELTGRRYARLYAYDAPMRLLNEETETNE